MSIFEIIEKNDANLLTHYLAGPDPTAPYIMNIDINVLNTEGYSLIHWCIKQVPQPLAQIYMLGALGANVNTADFVFGNTPLHDVGDPATAAVLIEQFGADPMKRNAFGLLPIEVVKYTPEFITRGANSLWHAGNNLKQMQWLLQQGGVNGSPIDPNIRDENGLTPLHYNVKRGSRCESIRLLIKFGASMDVVDHFGNTPLHDTADLETSRALLDVINTQEAAPGNRLLRDLLSRRNCEGLTPLEAAIRDSDFREDVARFFTVTMLYTEEYEMMNQLSGDQNSNDFEMSSIANFKKRCYDEPVEDEVLMRTRQSSVGISPSRPAIQTPRRRSSTPLRRRTSTNEIWISDEEDSREFVDDQLTRETSHQDDEEVEGDIERLIESENDDISDDDVSEDVSDHVSDDDVKTKDAILKFDPVLSFIKARNAIDRPGRFCYFKKVPELWQPLLQFEGITETLAMPLSVQQTQLLIKIAEQNSIDQADNTVDEGGAQKVWKIPSSSITINNPMWRASFEELLQEIRSELGVKPELRADLSNLVISESGSKFVSDSENPPGMFGTVAVILPSFHEGGRLVVKYGNEMTSLDCSGSEGLFAPVVAAFYADCEHKLEEVTNGYRVSLVFNLIRIGNTTLPKAPTQKKAINLIKRMSKKWVDVKDHKTPLKLIYFLDNSYSLENLSWEVLKARDTALADVIYQSYEFDLFLATVTLTERGDDGNGYGSPFIGERILTTKNWISHPRLDIPKSVFHAAKSIALQPNEFAQFENYFQTQIEDGSEHNGPVGFENSPMSRWYHRAALIFWPIKYRMKILKGEALVSLLHAHINSDYDAQVYGYENVTQMQLSLVNSIDSHSSGKSLKKILEICCRDSVPVSVITAFLKNKKTELIGCPPEKIIPVLHSSIIRHQGHESELAKLFGNLLLDDVKASEEGSANAWDYLCHLLNISLESGPNDLYHSLTNRLIPTLSIVPKIEGDSSKTILNSLRTVSQFLDEETCKEAILKIESNSLRFQILDIGKSLNSLQSNLSFTSPNKAFIINSLTEYLFNEFFNPENQFKSEEIFNILNLALESSDPDILERAVLNIKDKSRQFPSNEAIASILQLTKSPTRTRLCGNKEFWLQFVFSCMDNIDATYTEKDRILAVINASQIVHVLNIDDEPEDSKTKLVLSLLARPSVWNWKTVLWPSLYKRDAPFSTEYNRRLSQTSIYQPAQFYEQEHGFSGVSIEILIKHLIQEFKNPLPNSQNMLQNWNISRFFHLTCACKKCMLVVHFLADSEEKEIILNGEHVTRYGHVTLILDKAVRNYPGLVQIDILAKSAKVNGKISIKKLQGRSQVGRLVNIDALNKQEEEKMEIVGLLCKKQTEVENDGNESDEIMGEIRKRSRLE
ncbi:hypothetical protein HK096_011000 [Nowakowskiella sp. JEL0078]|nr:hypothetical protein HK096_011000 [Nowakowskiella sp. JEL0078]